MKLFKKQFAVILSIMLVLSLSLGSIVMAQGTENNSTTNVLAFTPQTTNETQSNDKCRDLGAQGLSVTQGTRGGDWDDDDCGTIKVYKKYYYKGDDTKPQSGVTFEVLKDGEVVASGTTNSDGYVEFDNLPPGNYTVVEVVPAGFETSLSDNGQQVKVEKGKTKKVEVYNTPLLSLVAVCTDDPDEIRRWIITNESNVKVYFKWKTDGSWQTDYISSNDSHPIEVQGTPGSLTIKWGDDYSEYETVENPGEVCTAPTPCETPTPTPSETPTPTPSETPTPTPSETPTPTPSETPTPTPSETPTPTPSETPTPTPSETPTPTPSETPTPTPSETPTPTPSETPTPTPSETPTPTPSETPTPTPTETPTPTPSETPTPTPTIEPEDPELTISNYCTSNPNDTRKWRIRNTGDEDVWVHWYVWEDESQSGEILVEAGKSKIVTTDTVSTQTKENTLIISWWGPNEDRHSEQFISKGLRCSTPPPESTPTPDPSPTPTPTVTPTPEVTPTPSTETTPTPTIETTPSPSPSDEVVVEEPSIPAGGPDDGEDDGTVVEEGEVPLGNLPKTGDTSPLPFYLIGAFSIAIGLIAIRRQKAHKQS